ncbi:thioredoxin family protein [Lebetimonas sp. JS032]|uniref:thioredoxin family protein n=1 Tax=Lebetimonas sp. JS032 TaxID=990070 RepID=UPI000463C99D|nr:thioredoxin family protein [Lebetimonas sp. JS032]
MKKFLFPFILLINLFAFNWYENIHWVKSYNMAKIFAKKEHKLILTEIAGIKCPPSKYFSKYVYSDKKVSDFINKNFIPVFYFIQQNSIPETIKKHFKGVTPTLIFSKPDGKIFYILTGARNKPEFLKVLKALIKQYHQKFKKASINSPKPVWLQIPKNKKNK